MADTLTTILQLGNASLDGSLEAYRLEIHKEGETRSKQYSLEAVKERIASEIPAGADGEDGTDGADGADGPQGPPGLVYQGEWNPGRIEGYVANTDWVIWAGSSWLAIGVNGPGNEPGVSGSETEWQVMAQKGDVGGNGADGEPGTDGADGAPGADGANGTPGPTLYFGEWGETWIYDKGQIVAYQGRFYISGQDVNVGQPPGLEESNWRQIDYGPPNFNGTFPLPAGNITLDGGLMSGYPTNLQDWLVQAYNDITVLKVDMAGKFSGVTDPAIACTVDNGRIVSQ